MTFTANGKDQCDRCNRVLVGFEAGVCGDCRKKERQREESKSIIREVMDEMPRLTKREVFAIMALQGLLSNCTEDGEFSGLNCASVAVEEADALLKELEK